MTDLNFNSIDLIEVPVKIAGKSFTLREASEDFACQFRNKQLQYAKMTDGKVTGMAGVASTEPFLVSLCLFDENNKPVPLATINRWPARVVKPLFAEAKKISELDEDSLESLQKQRDDLNERIETLRKDAVKNE